MEAELLSLLGIQEQHLSTVVKIGSAALEGVNVRSLV